jgi:hypothetical protein
MDPATIAALTQLVHSTSLAGAALVAVVGVIYWTLRGPVDRVATAYAAKLTAEGNAAMATQVAHTATLAEVAKTLSDVREATTAAVREDGDLTRADVAEVGAHVVALDAKLPIVCPVPPGLRPAECPAKPASAPEKDPSK